MQPQNKDEISFIKRIASSFLEPDDAIKIDKASTCLYFKKGETILKQGAFPTHIAVLETGMVKFNYCVSDNKNLILTIVSAPKILGGANLFYKDKNLFSIVAICDCRVVLIDSDVLLQVLSHNAKFAISIHQLASEMFKNAILNFISLAHKHKEGRIADVLLYLSQNVYSGNIFELNLTRKEIAEFAGCSTENVIMTFSKWEKEQIIKQDGKTLSILQNDKLIHISKIG